MSRSHVQGPEPVDVGAADHLPGRLSALAERWPQQPAPPDSRHRRGVDGAGEVLVAGGNVFRGYHGEDDRAGLDGGWFRTGDLGNLDDDGFLTLRDRAKDVLDDHLDDKTEPSYG